MASGTSANPHIIPEDKPQCVLEKACENPDSEFAPEICGYCKNLSYGMLSGKIETYKENKGLGSPTKDDDPIVMLMNELVRKLLKERKDLEKKLSEKNNPTTQRTEYLCASIGPEKDYAESPWRYELNPKRATACQSVHRKGQLCDSCLEAMKSQHSALFDEYFDPEGIVGFTCVFQDERYNDLQWKKDYTPADYRPLTCERAVRNLTMCKKCQVRLGGEMGTSFDKHGMLLPHARGGVR
ncbi:hypothetical protein K491DRAFT_715813 [Lophiostoma macrostomum CBS 122681]|uniref:Uncharacterized protein n=1 Tax=Lophiostoma macrostomum CBS 122681 TaxID=1314788 RepID=A0A6A6T9I3_9PLEO|nr:hypothetical protein K491DRAFT_715813 [Lophiostoma macrostomum CBS 122681]